MQVALFASRQEEEGELRRRLSLGASVRALAWMQQRVLAELVVGEVRGGFVPAKSELLAAVPWWRFACVQHVSQKRVHGR